LLKALVRKPHGFVCYNGFQPLIGIVPTLFTEVGATYHTNVPTHSGFGNFCYFCSIK